jgi:hypothetical protein
MNTFPRGHEKARSHRALDLSFSTVSLVTVVLMLAMSHVGAHEKGRAQARAIIEKAIAAKGGKDHLARLQGWHIKYKETFHLADKQIVETGEGFEQFNGNQARYESPAGPTLILNGNQGWIKRTDGKVVTMTPRHVGDFEEYLQGKRGILMLLPLLTDQWQLTALGETADRGRGLDVVRIRWKDRWTATTFWDQKTHLLAKAEFVHKKLGITDDAQRTVSQRTMYFADYREISGIRCHTRVRTYTSDKLIAEAELTAIVLHEQLHPDLFAQPIPGPE